MFTGKAKKQFEEWYVKNIEIVEIESIDDCFDINGFYDLPTSMQWGVIQDWADSMGFEMWVEKAIAEFRYWYNIYEKDGRPHYNEGFQTRQEARNAAIKAFDEIANRDTRKVKHKK